jgi:hypothetical protein
MLKTMFMVDRAKFHDPPDAETHRDRVNQA